MRAHRIESLFAGLLLAGGAAALAQCGSTVEGVRPAPPPAEVPDALVAASSPSAGEGVLTATLVRSRTGRSLVGSLTVTGPDGFVRSASGGANGFVRVDGLPLGVPLDIVATAPGLVPVPVRRIRLDSDEPFDLWDLLLGEAIPVEVRVRDEERRPIPGATVEVRECFTSYGYAPRLPGALKATTAGDGRAFIPDAPPGRWDLVTSADGYGTESRSLELVEGALREALVVVLGPGHALEGRLLDARGSPAAGRELTVILDNWGGPAGTATTDSAGRFRFENLPKGRVWIAAPFPAGVFEVLGEAVVPAEAPRELREIPRGEIRGRVLDDATGLPVEGAAVRFVCDGIDGVRGSWFGRSDGARSGTDGTFLIRDLSLGPESRPGSHGCPVDRIGVTREGYLSEWLPRRGTMLEAPCVVPVGAPPTEAASLEVRLRRGTVVVHGVVRTRDGKPVPGAWVSLGLGDPRGEWSTLDTTSDAEGRYRLPPAPPGHALLMAGAYMLHLMDMGRGPEFEAPLHSDRRIVLPERGEVERDLVLVPDSAIEGRMVLADGRPAEGYLPVLVRSNGNESSDERGAPSDEDGRFRIEQLRALEGVTVAARGPRVQVGVSRPFDLAESECVTGVVVRVVLLASVSGRVVGPGGAPVGGAWVRLELAEAATRPPWDKSLDADPDGAFLVEETAAGRWTAIAGAPGFLDSEGVLLDLAEGETRAGVLLTLREGDSIAGRVLDATGAPVSGATVGAFRVPEPRPWTASVLVKPGGVYADGSSGADQVTESGADGAFRIPGLEGKTYFVAALKEGRLGSVASARAGSTGLVLRVRGRAAVSGVVVDPAGDPVEGASVSVVAPEWSVEEGRRPQGFGSARFDWLVDMEDTEDSEIPEFLGDPKGVSSGPDGAFRIDCPEGECRLVASMKGFVLGEAIVRAPAVDARIRLRPRMTLAGRVVGPGGDPVSDAQVWARAADAEGFEDWATSREDGTFVVTGLPPGSYGLRAESREANLVPAEREVVAEAGAEGVVVPTREGFRFRARFVLPDGGAPSVDDYAVIVEEFVDGERRVDQVPLQEGGLLELRGLGNCTLRLHALRDDQPFNPARPVPGTVFGPFEVPGPDRTLTLGK
jgi:protocatechuate 3,4-dioxygenase beta subunit